MYGGIANNNPVIQKKKDCREAALFFVMYRSLKGSVI